MPQGVRERARFVATCLCYMGAFFCLLTIGWAPTRFGGMVGRLRARLTRYPRCLVDVCPESGHCFLARVPIGLNSDANGQSRIVVFEDGVALPKPHAPHDLIRKEGLGAYSHWNGVIYFATADNTDPRSNGRRYTYGEV